jgi:hypothetical protein
MFPALITVLATMLWNDIREIKTDVKALMAQSNIDKTRIDNLERSVYGPTAANKPINNVPYSPADVPDKPDLFFIRQESSKKKVFRPQIASNH